MTDMVPWGPDWKIQRLQSLYNDWAECRACPLHETRCNVVFGDGNPDADIMLIGEAPGADEDEHGRPFIGASGQFLRNLLRSIGVDDGSVYITNCIMCRPPDNREPRKEEKDACRSRLQAEIYTVDPLLIVAVGSTSFKHLVGGRATSIEKQHGILFTCEIPGKKLEVLYDVLPIYHPAYILRKDGLNKSGSWRKGGIAEATFKDLKEGVELVSQLKNLYDRTTIGDDHG
jgi:uracil-DNA glycosylase family 4